MPRCARTFPTLAAVAAALAALPARAASPGGPAAGAGGLSAEGRALVEKCVATYGGKAALARGAAFVHEGTVTSIRHPGVTGRLGRAYARPGRLRVEIVYPAAEGEIRVLDGGRGWRDGREVTGPPLDAMVLQAARLDLPALLSAGIGRARERGTLEHEGRVLRVLALEVGPGLEIEAALDPRTGRILRSRGVSTASPGVEFVTTYSDFRTVDGVLVAFREGNWANGVSTGETVLGRVEFGGRQPEGMFRP